MVHSDIIIIETKEQQKGERKMRKKIKVDDVKKKIEELVKIAIQYNKDGDNELYEYCYNKAICYKTLIQEIAIDYAKPSYSKEFSDIDDWFTEITNNAIYK